MADQQLVDFQDPQIRQVLRQIVTEVVEDFVRTNEMRAREFSLLERVLRVEEELKALREMAQARFEAIDKRFEALYREMDTRFEAMDKRFEALYREMNIRFEAMDKRFEAMEKRLTFLQWFMGVGFTLLMVFMTWLTYIQS